MEKKELENTLRGILENDKSCSKLNYIICLLAIIATLCIFILFSLFMLAE